MIINFRCIPAGYEDRNYDDGWTFSEGPGDDVTPSVEEADTSCEEGASSADRKQKVNVLPDVTIGVGLNGRNFIVDLTDEQLTFFEELKDMYLQFKNNPNVVGKLLHFYNTVPEAKRTALKLFTKCPGNDNLRNKNMAVFVLETLKSAVIQGESELLDDETRLVAFNFLKSTAPIGLMQDMTDVFELKQGIDVIEPVLREMLTHGLHKEVSMWSVVLQITQRFGIYDIVMPLVLQERIALVEDFLSHSSEEKCLETLKFLDTLIDRKRTVYEYCNDLIKEYKYTDIKLNILNPRPMCKLIGRLAKKLKIDSVHTPNLQHSKTVGYVHYLYYKYKEGGMSKESFRELVREEISNCREIQCDMIGLIGNNGNWEEAAYWIDSFQIPINEWPKSFNKEQLKRCIASDDVDGNSTNEELAAMEQPQQDKEENSNDHHQEQQQHHHHHHHHNHNHHPNSEGQKGNSVENRRHNSNRNRSSGYQRRNYRNYTDFRNHSGGNNSSTLNEKDRQGDDVETPVAKRQGQQEYLQLPFSIDHIVIVDDHGTFMAMLDEFNDGDIIAFDTEWKPSATNDNTVAVLQLAIHDKVFLVDCITETIDANMWKLLGNKVFNNTKIMKVGFSMEQDVRLLEKRLNLNEDSEIRAHFLDLRKMWRYIKCMKGPVCFPYTPAALVGEGLNVLAELCLGKPLDKSDQCSNWANRPLRREQIIYAALDAHCLLQIYKVLKRMLVEAQADLDDVLAHCLGAGNQYRKQKNAVYRKEVSVEEEDGTIDVDNTELDSGAVTPSLVVTESSSSNIQPADITQNLSSMGSIRFICDTMFVGLSRELRKLGFDCIQVFKNAPLSMYLERASRECRYILTRGERIKEFSKVLPAKQCLDLPIEPIEKLVITLINHLNVEVESRYFQTRCLKCNSCEFILASRNDMQTIYYGHILNNSRKVVEWKNTDTKACKLLVMSYYVLQSKKTYRGKLIRFDDNDLRALELYDYFLICNHCGIWVCNGQNTSHSKIKSFLKHREITISKERGAAAAAAVAASSTSSIHVGSNTTSNTMEKNHESENYSDELETKEKKELEDESNAKSET